MAVKGTQKSTKPKPSPQSKSVEPKRLDETPKTGPIPVPRTAQAKRQTHCFYHYDLDGCAAAAVVKLRIPTVILHLIDHGYDQLPPTPPNAEVIFVDFTPTLKDMTALVREGERNVIWIDHHAMNIQVLTGEGFGRLPGIRSTEHSGAYLTWRFFYKHLPVPEVLTLVDKWDTWTHNDDAEVLNFKAGIDIHDSSPSSPIWAELLNGSKTAVKMIQEHGDSIMKAKRIHWKQVCDMFGFECRFRHLRYGKFKCYAAFIPNASSLAFESKPGHDIYMALTYNGKQYRVNMFSAKAGCRVDEIASSMGGGGHPNAAGFWCDELPLTTDPNFDGTGSPAESTPIRAAVKD